ncbi:MAG: DJ-1/PfpI family protein [Dehalococcoidia bacterium]|nr:DJ-1/PfpI family protein [Dehalococcoidia bacterium]
MAEKKVLMVLSPHRFDEHQYRVCRQVIEGRKHKVAVTSVTGCATGDNGTNVPVDVAIKDVKTWDYDAVVFVGGEGMDRLFDSEDARKLAKDVKYKPMAAAGKGIVLLALAGAIEDKKVTGPVEMAGWLVKGKAKYTGEPLTVDDKLVTIRDDSMVEQMAVRLVEALEK